MSSSLILSGPCLDQLREDGQSAHRVAARLAFQRALRRVPRDIGPWLQAADVKMAMRLHNALLLLGGALASQATLARVAQAQALLRGIRAIRLDPELDEMYVAYLAVGLAAFEDLAGGLLDEPDASGLAALIDDCGRWLDDARHRRAYGQRASEGIFAWNHSVVAALALAVCGLHERDPAVRADRTAFGLDRLDKFFQHGITASGIPYEGFSYCGVVFRIVGLFGLLAGRDGAVATAHGEICRRHGERLGALLEWMDACSFPGRQLLISYNHAEYSSSLAVGGLLLFFGRTEPDKAADLWYRLVPASGGGAYGDSSDLARSCAFEAMFFLHRPAPARCPFRRQPIIDHDQGWVLLQSGAADAPNKVLVKSSRLLEGPHNQSDANHFTAILAGKPLFIDAGEATKVLVPSLAGADGPRDSYRVEGSGASSYGHNAIVIDGRGQAPSGDGHGVAGEVLRCESSGTAWITTASAKAAYDKGGYNPVRHAIRHVVFFAQPRPHLFVFDDIEADGRVRTFERLLQLPEVEASEDAPGLRRLRLRFAGSGYGAVLASGAAAAVTTTVSLQPASAPFNPFTTISDRVQAPNPYFWLLACLDEGRGADPHVEASDSNGAWHFRIGFGGRFERRLEVEKAAAAVPTLRVC